MIIMPYSPLPAEMEREVFWKTEKTTYDSGARQAGTTFARPLYRYRVPIKLLDPAREQTLKTFINSVKGETFPFLMKDPYDRYVNSVLVAASGVTHGATLSLYDTNSWLVRADTTTIFSLHSALSGFVTFNVEFTYNPASNILTVNTKAAGDVWGARSFQYFRKVAFDNTYRENLLIYDLWSVPELTIVEVV